MTKDEEEYWRYRTERFHEDNIPSEPKSDYTWVLTTVVIVGVFVVLLLCSLLDVI